MAFLTIHTPRGNLNKVEMIRDMHAKGMFFYHQKGFPGLELREKRTTAILLQPNDFLVVDKLEAKIDEGAEWPLSEFDFPIIKALSDMRMDGETVRLKSDPNSSGPHMYIVLALYLYLADMATIYPNKNEDSFMHACREAGFLDANDKKPIRTKLIDALDLLGLYQMQSIRNLIDEWEKYGTFKVDGLANFSAPSVTDHTTSGNGTQKVDTRGVYSTLARTLMRNSPEGEFSPVVLMNNCIAYAQYVKHKYKEIDSVADRQHEVLRHAAISAANQSYGLKAAGDGHDLRKKTLKDFADESKEALAGNYDKDKETAFFERIFPHLSDQVVSVYYFAEMEVGYSEEFGLRKLYPQKDIPGYSHASCETSRGSKGLNISRFKFAMFSSDEADINLTHEQQEFKLLHTVSHEALHIVFGNNGILNQNHQKEFEELAKTRKAILNKAPDIFRNLVYSKSPEIANFLDTVLPSTGFTFRQIIDVNCYRGYLGEEKTEEMLCNLYGLTQVEFLNSVSLNALNCNHPDLKPIQDLATELQTIAGQTVNVMKQNLGISGSFVQQVQQQQQSLHHRIH